MSWDEKQFRNALGRFTTGVCVVAARNIAKAPIAMTINSFSSVSLNPSLVQWSLKKDSICHDLFSEIDRCSISVLSHLQSDISKRYAMPGDHLMVQGDFQVSESGTPFVNQSLAHFECRRWQIYEAGDHDLVIAVVEKFVNERHEEPLVFYQGRYRALVIQETATH